MSRTELSPLTPIEQWRATRRPRRLAQLLVGLTLYGVSMAMMLRSGLGLDPWDVFHAGVVEHAGLTFGTVVIVVGAVVLLLWVPLRQWPGVGTVLNVVIIGLASDATLALLAEPSAAAARWAFLLGGIVANGVAGALYIGSQFGPGPRDGLMTGIVRRSGWSVRLVRTTLELSVLGIGWALGGTVGLGTVLYALLIGPVLQVFLPLLTVPVNAPGTASTVPPGTASTGTVSTVSTQPSGTGRTEPEASAVHRERERQHGVGSGPAQRPSRHGHGPAAAHQVVDEQDGAVACA
jgi:uncharacterized membrane protein YczE